MKPIQIKATFKPNYEVSCESCGQTPTVEIYLGDQLEERIGLCGACAWGEADCINPDNW